MGGGGGGGGYCTVDCGSCTDNAHLFLFGRLFFNHLTGLLYFLFHLEFCY